MVAVVGGKETSGGSTRPVHAKIIQEADRSPRRGCMVVAVVVVAEVVVVQLSHLAHLMINRAINRATGSHTHAHTMPTLSLTTQYRG